MFNSHQNSNKGKEKQRQTHMCFKAIRQTLFLLYNNNGKTQSSKPNQLHLRAIVKAIELSASNCLFHHQHLIIESDSVNAISWMNKPHNRPWKHHNLFSSVNRLKAYFGSITFSHIFRESNCMTDCMAKQGVQRSSDFVAWL